MVDLIDYNDKEFLNKALEKTERYLSSAKEKEESILNIVHQQIGE